MKPLFNSAQVRVHLAAEALIACEVKRVWGRTCVTRKERFPFDPGERAGAMDALADWMARSPTQRSILWIVGPSEARYFVLPWSPSFKDRGLRDAYARAHFEQKFDKDASRAAFYFASASDYTGQLVSCVPIELPVELAAFARRTHCELDGIKPSIHVVWDRFRDVLETEQGTLCIDDGDRQAIVRHDRQRIREVTVKSADRLASIKRGGVLRRFSNDPSKAPATPSSASSGELNLPARNGFAAAEDRTYSFALCGAF